jgi:hypothetical protein
MHTKTMHAYQKYVPGGNKMPKNWWTMPANPNFATLSCQPPANRSA